MDFFADVLLHPTFTNYHISEVLWFMTQWGFEIDIQGHRLYLYRFQVVAVMILSSAVTILSSAVVILSCMCSGSVDVGYIFRFYHNIRFRSAEVKWAVQAWYIILFYFIIVIYCYHSWQFGNTVNNTDEDIIR